jgi:outer membrane protein assembly factor BamB
VLLVGDLLLVQSEEPGELSLVAPTPKEHRELARIPAMEGKSWNYPAISGRTLLMRNAEEMVCFELPVE